MKILSNKLAWTSVGAAVMIVSGTPVWADDTELFLVTPGGNNSFNANILLILDSSGSMDSIESVNEPYDSTAVYGGDCDSAKLYWTRTGLVPSCDGSNNAVINGDAFVCKKADRQMNAVGQYQGVLVQYRQDVTGGNAWRQLGPGFDNEIVECKEDSGFDGDGSLNYAQAGTDLDPYTADPAKEVAWGSYPASESYVVYSGNYLNWRTSPVKVDMQRTDIMKIAAKTALTAINSSNIGIMRFSGAEGGIVIQAMTDLDSNRTLLDSIIDGIPADGNTPLSETLYEAALYWLGRTPNYGGTASVPATDPNALIAGVPLTYNAPDSPVCTKNYNVLLTDGSPNNNEDETTLVPTLPGYEAKLGRTTCTGTADGDCLDDIAEYLSIPDLDSGQQGDQFVTTHTIGFTVDLPLLKTTAEVSGGEYYLADDVENLTRALLRIFREANDQELAFTAPSVAVNAFNRTQNLNDLYMSVFRSAVKYHWPGNLKKYRLSDGIITDLNGNPAVDQATGFFADTATSFWTVTGPDGKEVELGGAAHQQPAPASRKVYTNNGDPVLTAGSNAISAGNAAAYAAADFGLTGAAGEPSVTDVIDWVNGSDVLDDDSNPATTQRNVMGDPLHAQPGIVAYGGTPGNEDIVVYSATNDGYLHAIDATTGAELWSFIPNELLSRLGPLMINPDASFKSYGIDGDVVPVFIDRDNNGIIDGTDFAYIVVGMRRGGSSYYALDVTNKNAPRLLWQVSYPGMGQSWSRPVIARVNVNDPGLNADKAVVILGGGYDPVHDTATYPTAADNAGAVVTMLDLNTGAELWRAGRDLGSDLVLANMTRAIPSQVRVVDLNGDRFADRMYAADVGGQIWRFDIFNGETPANLVTGGVVAQVGAEGIASPALEDTRRVYNSPDVALVLDNNINRRFIAVNVGTGYRAHPLDTSATDAFYSFRDPDVFTRLSQFEYDSYDVATDADFVEVAGSTQAVITGSDRGWKFTLPGNQMVLSNSIVFNDELFFVAFAPDTVAATECTVRVGRNFLYRVSILNGDPIVNNIDALADADADPARVEELAQGGIAPSPRFLFPSPDPSCTGDDCMPPPVGCVGVECFDPGFVNNPVRTLWTQDGID